MLRGENDGQDDDRVMISKAEDEDEEEEEEEKEEQEQEQEQEENERGGNNTSMQGVMIVRRGG